MKNSSKIILLILTLAIIALAYFSYPVIKNRYFSEQKSFSDKIENVPNEPENTPRQESTSVQENGPDSEETIKKEEPGTIISEDQTTIFKEIKKEDCSGGCSDLNSEEEKVYCLQACGFPSSFDGESEGCFQKSSLEKDYCYKNAGIKNKNLDDCKKITDINIRDLCINIVTESILKKTESVQ